MESSNNVIRVNFRRNEAVESDNTRDADILEITQPENKRFVDIYMVGSSEALYALKNPNDNGAQKHALDNRNLLNKVLPKLTSHDIETIINDLIEENYGLFEDIPNPTKNELADEIGRIHVVQEISKAFMNGDIAILADRFSWLKSEHQQIVTAVTGYHPDTGRAS